jgi:hypothetical protein
MKYTKNDYLYFPEKWPYVGMHYRLTFMQYITYTMPTNKQKQHIHGGDLFKGQLTDLLSMHLNLWDIRIDVIAGQLQIYCNSISWLAIVKLAYGDDPTSPIQSLFRVESWCTPGHPLP